MEGIEWIEDEATHIVLVFDRGWRRVVARALQVMYSRSVGKANRFVIHVVSPMGNILYLRALRDLINRNFRYTITIRFHGESPEDLEELVKKYGERAIYVIDNDMTHYKSILEANRVRSESIIEVAGR